MGGHGHGIQQRGRVVGLRGNSKLDLRQLAAARITTGPVVVEPRGIHHSAAQRGIRVKVPNITTAGERTIKQNNSKPDERIIFIYIYFSRSQTRNFHLDTLYQN